MPGRPACLAHVTQTHSVAVLQAPEAWAMLLPVHLALLPSVSSPYRCSQNGSHRWGQDQAPSLKTFPCSGIVFSSGWSLKAGTAGQKL